MLAVTSPSNMSIAVAPASLYTAPGAVSGCIFNVASPSNVIIGGVVSTTFTVRVTSIATFPAASVTLYDTIYVPNMDVFTLLTITIEEDMSPS